MSTNSERILGDRFTTPQPYPLFDTATTRRLESLHTNGPEAESLMQRAGLATAKLAAALAPHARLIWIPCGPGNNGGDGLEAAFHLHRMGKQVVVSELPGALTRTGDALKAHQRAANAGVMFQAQAPNGFDFCVDALFGIGKCDGFDTHCQAWIAQMSASNSPVLAVDIPTGLHADTGAAANHVVRADFTLSLLTLKPGLFTAEGRALSGEIWFNALDAIHTESPMACLGGPPSPESRAHNTHKGSFGDVAVIGGDTGMVGAAVLAARAALQGGAGRVFMGLLANEAPALDNNLPELMVREARSLPIETMAVAAGCGGGSAMAACLLNVVQRSRQLVLDADALNHLALSTEAQRALTHRAPATTVLTPHPLEAARLLATSVSSVQANRIAAAQSLADRWQCVVVLKGSGSVIAAPGRLPCINPTGNARLATAGTGDVLAGLIASYLAQQQDAFSASCAAVNRHGTVADHWPANAGALTAHQLAQAL
ncbi:MAG: bifunctional ADP-dependent NAD(P)H-hydrate dehydratase/NAD(P)H-hydrate epimerase [Burkholderiales bacterium PBB3]|nr:MAG: bifunctional ADP-dependent NAD(P)H-hydrate dehydratase/NAD(P)H-hydrate epimerase [Burkholderiales bacterium PBB3]